jgi:hypothetical protein
MFVTNFFAGAYFAPSYFPAGVGEALSPSDRASRMEFTALISEITAKTIGAMFPGDRVTISMDWGSNIDNLETGCLKDGETIASCAVGVVELPEGAVTPNFSSVAVSAAEVRINKRKCRAGECTLCVMGTTSNQVLGTYRIKFVATTSFGNVFTRIVRIRVNNK